MANFSSENEFSRKELFEAIGETVDALVTLDINGRGVIRLLCAAARERQERPLTLLAAEKLCNVVKEGDLVIVSPGARARTRVQTATMKIP